MKIIFLDIDGVLNNGEWVKKNRNFHNFDPENVNQLNRIIEQTGAKVVISSTWRLYPYNFYYLFKSQNINCEVIGVTPNLSTDIRGDEIITFLSDWNGEKIEKYVILDDCEDMGCISPRLVKTNYKFGLTASDAKKAIDLLINEAPYEM